MIEVNTEVGPVDSGVEICVVEDDGRGFASEFESDLLQIAGSSSFHDRSASDG